MEEFHIPHVVQSCPTDLALGPLDNLNTLNVGVEHLHRHLHSDTCELVSEQERSVDSAELDAQDNAVERIAILECDANNVSGSNAPGVSAIIEQSLALTLGVKGFQLRFGDLGDGIFACFAGRRGRVEDLDGFGGYS